MTFSLNPNVHTAVKKAKRSTKKALSSDSLASKNPLVVALTKLLGESKVLIKSKADAHYETVAIQPTKIKSGIKIWGTLVIVSGKISKKDSALLISTPYVEALNYLDVNTKVEVRNAEKALQIAVDTRAHAVFLDKLLGAA